MSIELVTKYINFDQEDNDDADKSENLSNLKSSSLNDKIQESLSTGNSKNISGKAKNWF